jgi:hypothetical protein
MLQALNSEQGQGYEIIMAEELRHLAYVTMDVMHCIATGCSLNMDTLAKALDRAEVRLMALRQDGATRRFNLQKLIQFFAFYHEVRSMGKDILAYGRDPLTRPNPGR